MSQPFSQAFIEFAIQERVLRFGEFTTKAGRLSPYFFNAGLFNDGASLLQLSDFYAQALQHSKLPVDMIFGPAYKGISLAAGLAMRLAEKGQNLPFCFNRKEAKDHGEGGNLIGAPLQGRVLIIDDVISAGTSVRESVKIIENAGAQVAGVIIALDRMEKGAGTQSAVQEVVQQYGVPVISIANLQDLLQVLSSSQDAALSAYLQKVQDYRHQYGV